MLKIKGLKKKKKGKKGKHKEDDLFDPEELEQYRREHQQKSEAGEASETSGEGTSSTEKSEEWKKFQALTAGVDDILKKTQGDLDRIKSTSYFQRKPPGPSNTESRQESKGSQPEGKPTKWTRFAEDGSVLGVEEPEQKEDNNSEEVKQVVKDPPVEEEEDEEESEQDEDIFDTSYVDVVASGDVKLAYIPDSPTEEETGPDPFDTSIVDQVIKVDPKKRNLVSLGCAVEVLTGRVDKAIPVVESGTKIRKRPKKQDLLGSFDEVETTNLQINAIEEPQQKSILDEEPEYVPEEINLSINLATTLPQPSPLVERKDIAKTENKDQQLHKSLVEEFYVTPINTDAIANIELDDELDDEFAALAQESVLKETVRDTLDSSNNTNFEEHNLGVDIDEIDPFDTAFAANILPGKYELKLIEEEILLKDHYFPQTSLPKYLEDIPSVRLNDATNEHNFLEEDQTPLSFKHRDLLGGSTTDLSKISDCPIEPVIRNDRSEELTYSDPFDTSVVDDLVAPGKTELKFLEKELLDGVISQIEDESFDPRANSPHISAKPPARPDQLPVGEKRLSIPKVVAFNIGTLQTDTDLLAVDQEENSKVSKPLTPYYANPEEVNNRPSCESESNFIDPFDTSFVSHAPGKAELKLIESELIVESTLKHNLSDPDFNPRQESGNNIQSHSNNSVPPQPPTTLPVKAVYQPPERLQPDFLSEDSEITVKLHTPVVPKKIEDDLDKFDYIDPFDTSIVNDVLPGKAELRILENEFINSDSGTNPSIKRSYTDPDFNPRHSPEKVKEPGEDRNNFIDNSEDISVAEKPLTPESATTSKISFDLGDIDPFDTSCIGNLVPGKAELKLLESELFN